MEILPGEVEFVKDAGTLFDSDVKMVKTIGGFWMAIGKKDKGVHKKEVLAAGSHHALVLHKISQQYGADFKQNLFKSESDRPERVEDKSTYLSSDMLKKGVELFTLSKNEKYTFVLYKNGLTLAQYDTVKKGENLEVSDVFINKKIMNFDKKMAKAMANAIEEKAQEIGVSKIER